LLTCNAISRIAQTSASLNAMLERVVEWTDFAQADLRAIVFHIALGSIENAMTVMKRIERRAVTLHALSRRGRSVTARRRFGKNP
jgi:plasmid stabilization system protein ParE